MRYSHYEHVNPVTKLEADRARVDQKVKSRYEDIFRKYEHNFTGIGDKIDMATGDLVVDKGHIEHMRHELARDRAHVLHLEDAQNFDTGDEDAKDAKDAEMFSEPGTETTTTAPSQQDPFPCRHQAEDSRCPVLPTF
ncbi:hypothetical protein AC578_4111 [Pseudocercospora eumusae]|uniref:Uncharacterized protein n=1 Tax=Pseudocercospora eumusae TaxID=321146 RepID=A0A139HF85_9PEZI|nr:hypothetical protein AC578_4111 [Pseudocercospora eumusae]